MTSHNKKMFKLGLKHGVPIGLGYFAVAFTLGLSAGNIGFNPFTAGLMSLLMHASAGQFAAMNVISAGSGYIEMAVTTVIINLRYFLMSCSLSQKLKKDTAVGHRFLISHFITDELFGISIALDEPLVPAYYYGAALVASPGWVFGTALGCLLGNVLPGTIAACLSIALYGMFLAIVIPPAKKNHFLMGVVIISMLVSAAFTVLPVVKKMSSSTQVIVLTIVISAIAAIVKPINTEEAKEVES